jgi:DNA-binding HxlR family transcriptional regulator
VHSIFALEDELMKKAQHKRSPCPIACTLDLLGDKWTLLLIRDMLFGRTYFNEFCRSPERIATNILADRLEKLVAQGLVEKYIAKGVPARDAYRLTDKGRSLKSILEAVAKWGLANIEGTEARMRPA